MQIKKVLIHAFILGAAAATYRVDPTIDWSASCTDQAVVANWDNIRTTLNGKIPKLRSILGSSKYQQVLAVLGGPKLPKTPNLEIEHALVNIVGATLMEEYIGSILQTYWHRHPCTEPTHEPTGPEYSASSEESVEVSSPPYYTASEESSSETPEYSASEEESSSETPEYSASEEESSSETP
ncbi:hypothetical protein GGF43_001278, partial [Coemansia sp. RSA 2618]